MGKKPTYGICKLCGKRELLTYEHVPPRGAFNNHSIRQIRGDKLLEHIGSDAKPWDVSGLWGQIHQQGIGDYYLCKGCNEKTGSWYVPFYLDFVRGIYAAVETADPTREAPYIGIKAPQIRPLPIFKEIMVMFCDINHNCFGDNNLRSYLLEKDSPISFDKKKYRVFSYITKGDIFRMNGLSMLLLTSKNKEPLMIQISEISYPPLGFALYIDLPNGYEPKGREITGLCDFKYEDIGEFETIFPVLENNIMFSGDYRTKDEIEKTIKESKAWEDKHKDLIDRVNNRGENT